MSRPAPTPAADALTAPSYRVAGLVSLVVLALYIVTLGPTTGWWDASEYIAAAWTVGLPHPPGNPMFVLLGRVAALLPVAPTVAARVNLLAAVSSAISAGVWFLVAERVAARWTMSCWQRRAAGTLAALTGATAFTVWSQSVVNEKVYTITLAGFAVIAWLMIRWLDEPDGRAADRRLVLVAFLLGLGYANHMAGMLAAPAAAVLVLWKRPGILLRWRLLLAGAGAMVLGVSPFATQPIRAAHHPPMNLGAISECNEGPRLDCTLSAETFERFRFNFLREQYPKVGKLDRQASFGDQLGMWWLYFRWQWWRDVNNTQPGVQIALAFAFLGLAAAGAAMHARHDRETFVLVATLVGTLTVGLVWYLNFKLGWTQAFRMGLPYGTDLAEVRDRDYFFLWGFSLLGIWIGLGMLALWRELTGIIARVPIAGRGAVAGVLASMPVLALACLPLIGNWRAAARNDDTTARAWARDLLQSVEPYGILISMGDNDSFPLWYAQEVEGVRRDVTVAISIYLRSTWYIHELMRRPTVVYDAAAGPAAYRDREWPVPTRPLISLSAEELDAIPPAIMLEEPQPFTAGTIDTMIPAGVLSRDQILVLRFILDSFPTRPLHFTAGGYERALGLGEYSVRHGLTHRLNATRAADNPEYLPVDGDWLDVASTRSLWEQTFNGPDALMRRGRWPERSSISIPIQYAVTGSVLARALDVRGEAASASVVSAQVGAIVRDMRLMQ